MYVVMILNCQNLIKQNQTLCLHILATSCHTLVPKQNASQKLHPWQHVKEQVGMATWWVDYSHLRPIKKVGQALFDLLEDRDKK